MATSPSSADDLALAHQIADVATGIALEFFNDGVETIRKPDNTPVSEADLEVERQIRAILERERPDDAVLGEEFGATGESTRRWILDPIDGTFNFVESKPAWGTHVALEVDGEIVLGLVTRPVYGHRYWATTGGGAFRSEDGVAEPERLSVSTVTDLAESRVTVWARQSDDMTDRLRNGTRFVEGDLDSVLAVVSGELEAVVEAPGLIWDHAPAVMLIKEAGGTYLDSAGGRRPDLGPSRYTNGLIDADLARLIAG